MIETYVKCEAPDFYKECTSSIPLAEIAKKDWWEIQLDGNHLTIKKIVNREDVHAEAQHACSYSHARKLGIKLIEDLIPETIEEKSNE